MVGAAVVVITLLPALPGAYSMAHTGVHHPLGVAHAGRRRTLRTVLVDVFFWQPLITSALIIAIPVGLAYNLFLNRLIQGLTHGALKG